MNILFELRATWPDRTKISKQLSDKAHNLMHREINMRSDVATRAQRYMLELRNSIINNNRTKLASMKNIEKKSLATISREEIQNVKSINYHLQTILLSQYWYENEKKKKKRKERKYYYLTRNQFKTLNLVGFSLYHDPSTARNHPR